ncbi:hypothetical protein [Paenibacillus sp. SAF-068]|uniref:hypothetical protein n=1 Tax=Paenibacillus sp. SAF-068 TaxID=3436864 RepID=UPI003F7EA9A0
MLPHKWRDFQCFDPVKYLPEHAQLFSFLKKYSFSIPEGHLKQALWCHYMGFWAAANAQIRTFFESVFDAMAVFVFGGSVDNLPSKEKREKLKETIPPILSRNLNEVGNNGRNFSEGIFKRLHAEGSHPGLSNPDDCTFRLNLVVLTSTYYLCKFDQVAALAFDNKGIGEGRDGGL